MTSTTPPTSNDEKFNHAAAAAAASASASAPSPQSVLCPTASAAADDPIHATSKHSGDASPKLSSGKLPLRWTKEEDAVLRLKHKGLGNKWTEISKHLPGRSDNAAKNRWKKLNGIIGSTKNPRSRNNNNMKKVATKTQQSKARAPSHHPCHVKTGSPPPPTLHSVGKKTGPSVPLTVDGFSLLKISLSELESTMTTLTEAKETKTRLPGGGATPCKTQTREGNASEENGDCSEKQSTGGCSSFSGNVPPALVLEYTGEKRALSASSPSPLPSIPKKRRGISRLPPVVKGTPRASSEVGSRISFQPRFSQGEGESSTAAQKPQTERTIQSSAPVDSSLTPVLLPESPEAPDSPEAPEAQGAPNSPEGPDAPETTEGPDSPEGPEAPEAPEAMTGMAIEEAAPLTTPEVRADITRSSLQSATLLPPGHSTTRILDEQSCVIGDELAGPRASSSSFVPAKTTIVETGVMPTPTPETSSLSTTPSSSPSQEEAIFTATRMDIFSPLSSSIPIVLPGKKNESVGETDVTRSGVDEADASASQLTPSLLAPDHDEAAEIVGSRLGAAADVASPSTASPAAVVVMSSSAGKNICATHSSPSFTKVIPQAQKWVRKSESSLTIANESEATLAPASFATSLNSTTTMDAYSNSMNSSSPSSLAPVIPTESNKRAIVEESAQPSSTKKNRKKFKTSEEERRQRAQTRPSRSRTAVAKRERAKASAKAKEDAFQREVFEEQPMTERDADLIRRAYLLGASKVVAGKNLAGINHGATAKSRNPPPCSSAEVGECTTRRLCPDLSSSVRLEWNFYEPSMFVALDDAADISSLDDLFDAEGTDLQIDGIMLPDFTTRGDDAYHQVDASSIVSV